MRVYLPVLFLLALGSYGAHRSMDQVDLEKPPTLRETLPSEEALHLLSLGFHELVADYYWLRALSEFGDRERAKAGYPNLEALVRRVLSLDPNFVTAYYFAGTALTVRELDPKVSIELLSKGIQLRPDDWRIAFLLGFNLYYFAHDYAGAARALAHAATLDGAPDVAGPLATRLAAEAGEPEIGLALVESMLRTTSDDKLRAMYEERRNLLRLEVELRWLNEAAERFSMERGRRPRSLDELKIGGFLTAIPKEPLGGRYIMDDQGRVATTHEARRLRMTTAGGEKKP